jgi:hypothetical protein
MDARKSGCGSRRSLHREEFSVGLGRPSPSEGLAGPLVATEVVRSLVGSIGLIASVPITTGSAVAVVGARRDRGEGEVPPHESSDADHDPEPHLPAEADPVAAPASWDDFSPEERDF